jgi:hypothetical protein
MMYRAVVLTHRRQGTTPTRGRDERIQVAQQGIDVTWNCTYPGSPGASWADILRGPSVVLVFHT